MTEFDFAELDKAVNDLMQGGTTVKRPDVTTISYSSDENNRRPEARPTTNESVDTHRDVNTSPVAASISITEKSAEENTADVTPQMSAPSLATKRRGRFMDVVHPSGDMKVTRAPKREGVQIQPISSPKKDQDDAPRDDTESSLPFTAAQDNASAQEESLSQADTPEQDLSHLDSPQNDYPDPLTMTFGRENTANRKQDDETSPDVAVDTSLTEPLMPENEQPTAKTLPENEEDEQLDERLDTLLAEQQKHDAEPEDEKLVTVPSFSEMDDQPLVSPFLPNTKVEKRPLGGPSSDENDLVESQTADEPVAAAEVPQDDVQTQPPVSLPAELSGAVMAIESSAVAHAPEPADTDTPHHTQDDMPSQERSEKPAPVMPGNGSIAQQYREQPSTTDQSSGSIYDTKTYHQPLDHPAKKKSGIGVIIWILSLMIIGAIAGTAYFYFTTQ